VRISTDTQYTVDLQNRLLAVAADPIVVPPKKEMVLLLPLNVITLLGELVVKRRRLRALLPTGIDLLSLNCSYRMHKADASVIAKMEGYRLEIMIFLK